MFPVKIVFLSLAIFVFVDGKNWYPKKYKHTIHKRVDPDYWEGLSLENNFLTAQEASKNKLSSNSENELIGNSFLPHPFDRNYSQTVLKRYKRDDFKIKKQKTKKYKANDKKSVSSKYGKAKKS